MQTYSYDELSEVFNALVQQRHSEVRDAGKEITKLLSSSNRVLKVRADLLLCKCWLPLDMSSMQCVCLCKLVGMLERPKCLSA